MSEPPVRAVKHRSIPRVGTGMRRAAPAVANSAALPGAARCAGGGHRGDRSPRRGLGQPLPGASGSGSSTPPSPRRCWCRLSLLLPFPSLPSFLSSFSLPCSALTAWDSRRRLQSRRSRPLFPPFAQFCFFLPVTPNPAAMRRPTRRLALSVLGVLWIAALLLLFFGARRKPEAEGPEGQTVEVRGHRALRGHPRRFRAAWKV